MDFYDPFSPPDFAAVEETGQSETETPHQTFLHIRTPWLFIIWCLFQHGNKCGGELTHSFPRGTAVITLLWAGKPRQSRGRTLFGVGQARTRIQVLTLQLRDCSVLLSSSKLYWQLHVSMILPVFSPNSFLNLKDLLQCLTIEWLVGEYFTSSSENIVI